jgi:hypothetical protein
MMYAEVDGEDKPNHADSKKETMAMATSSIFNPIVLRTKDEVERFAVAFEQAVEWSEKHPYKPTTKAHTLEGEELEAFIEKLKGKRNGQL